MVAVAAAHDHVLFTSLPRPAVAGVTRHVTQGSNLSPLSLSRSLFSRQVNRRRRTDVSPARRTDRCGPQQSSSSPPVCLTGEEEPRTFDRPTLAFVTGDRPVCLCVSVCAACVFAAPIQSSAVCFSVNDVCLRVGRPQHSGSGNQSEKHRHQVSVDCTSPDTFIGLVLVLDYRGEVDTLQWPVVRPAADHADSVVYTSPVASRC